MYTGTYSEKDEGLYLDIDKVRCFGWHIIRAEPGYTKLVIPCQIKNTAIHFEIEAVYQPLSSDSKT